MSEDIAKDTLKFTIKAVNTFMRTPEFNEGILDSVVKSASRRMFKQKKYSVKDEETGETYRDGKVYGVDGNADNIGTTVGNETVIWQ
jgi:hypothetical protein